MVVERPQTGHACVEGGVVLPVVAVVVCSDAGVCTEVGVLEGILKKSARTPAACQLNQVWGPHGEDSQSPLTMWYTDYYQR